MQKFSLLFLFIILLSGCGQSSKSSSYIQEIKKHRYDVNVKFADKETTPLTIKDFNEFSSLDFFPIDSTYRVIAKFVRTPDEIPFEMATTTDEKSIEVKYGEAHITLNGEQLKLNIYQNSELKLTPEYKNYLFLPFMDKTNGKESYGGGRYLDLEIPEDKIIILDFNKAYNPYCAYSDRYSCPIPPIENHLDVAINAGFKAFKN
jgi:uncharacterized protein (DUF1684 family)